MNLRSRLDLSEVWKVTWLIGLGLLGCQQKMAGQPSYRTYQRSDFFPDGRSARPLVAGVVPRGQPIAGDPLLTGLRPGSVQAAPVPNDVAGLPAADAPDSINKYVTAFPFPLSEADLRRGQQRFTIYCTVCHDPLGTGHGKIVERGYIQPPSYHEDNSRGFARYGIHVPLRDVPVGYIFEVISNGYGAMPDYAFQIPPEDRWRIAAYVRVLQLSQHSDLARLPEEQRRVATQVLGGAP